MTAVVTSGHRQDEAWGDIKLTNGSGIMMMGSTEGVPTGPPPAASSKDGKDPSGSAADEEVRNVYYYIVN